MESEGFYESENLAEPFFESLGEGFGDHEGFGESESLESLGEGFGESEAMFESEWEAEGLGEGEGPLGEFENEQFLGPLVSGISSLLGESEYENFGALENEGEQFFKKAFKGISGFIKKAAPILKKVAKIAAPIVGGAIGGPIGSKLGSMAGQLLGEGEYEGYYESELEAENEAEMEAVLEGPMSEQQALGELMAAAASRAVTDMEAEAQIGSATAIVLSPADRDALRGVLPSINRGVAVLTRILRRNPATRPIVRVIPAIVKRSAVTLRKQAASGRPVTRQSAARAVSTQTRRVLSSPATCAKAVQRNVNATRAAARSARTTTARPRPRPRYAI
jgi:hypothetical protein